MSIASPGLRAVVVAHGDLARADLEVALAVPQGAPEPLVIAADGGSALALEAGVTPDLVVGDGDSIPPDLLGQLVELGVELRLADREKDESDSELAVTSAAARGASEVVLVAALGGARPEHAIANLSLLAHPALAGVEASVRHRGSVFRLVGGADAGGSLVVHGEPGDYLSLLPLGDGVDGVRTEGLRFPLDDEPLPLGPARGLSNELIGPEARVHVRRGRLLVIHTPAAT